MVRTQIQIPDELYAELRAIAEAKEWSFAETLRRAGESFVRMFPQKQPPRGEWALPVVDLGAPLAPAEEWADILEEELVERHLK